MTFYYVVREEVRRNLTPERAMSSPESARHSFVIRIWAEEMAEGGSRLMLRGHITHVPGGEKTYLKDLDDIRTFMTPYVKAMGVDVAEPPE